jgi:hypothetical protein
MHLMIQVQKVILSIGKELTLLEKGIIKSMVSGAARAELLKKTCESEYYAIGIEYYYGLYHTLTGRLLIYLQQRLKLS